MGASFIVTDLEVTAPFDLTPLAQEFEAMGLCLHPAQQEDGTWLMCGSPGITETEADPASQIAEILRMVKRLSPAGRALWDQSSRREFDPGFAQTSSVAVARWTLPTEVLQAIAEVGGVLSFTIYRESLDD